MVDKEKIREALDCMFRNGKINVHGFLSIECGETSRSCNFRYACMAFKRAVNRTDNTERGDSKRTVDRLEDEGITPYYHIQGSGKPMHLRKRRPGQNWAGVK